jgi:hypothetical protein
MSKKITSNQLLGEIGEAAVRLRFLTIGFQFDGRSRLEAGVDGIAEVMDNGKPLARMIAVQIKATESSRYASEDEMGFSYLVRPDDLAYWRPPIYRSSLFFIVGRTTPTSGNRSTRGPAKTAG